MTSIKTSPLLKDAVVNFMRNSVGNSKKSPQKEIPTRVQNLEELKYDNPNSIYATAEESVSLSRFINSERIIRECRKKATSFCNSCNLSSFGLTEDDVFIIFASLHNIRNSEASVLSQLNKVLMSPDKSELTRIKPFLFYLLSSLRSLPVVDNSHVLYMCEDNEFLGINNYKCGHIISWPWTTVASKTVDSAKSYAKAAKKLTVFEVHGAYTGYNVGPFTDFIEDGKYFTSIFFLRASCI